MTDKPTRGRLEEKEYQEGVIRNSVEEDLKQFKRLRETYPDLSNQELAHRIVMTEKQLQRVRKLLGE
jgi:CRISPR/Cas system-associated protein endoribonuclease Cas2